MEPNELLILNYPKYSERIADWFGEMNASPAFREVFLADPAGTVSQAIFPDQPPISEGGVNQANRILFSALSNPEFMRWAGEYNEVLVRRAADEYPQIEDEQQRLRAFLATLDKSVVYQDIADAAPRFMDRELAHAWLLGDRDLETGALASVFVHVAIILLVAVIVVAVPVPLLGEGVNREDLRVVMTQLAQRLEQRAETLRAEGRLLGSDAARRGRKL
ncbi:hypothetical protein AB0J52_14015 [Spirillospora sp. NPDC049652]